MMSKLQRKAESFRAKMKKSKQGIQEVIEGDPTSQKNWKLGTGWYVGVDVYPTRDAELAAPERLQKLLPGALMPKDQAQTIQMLATAIKKNRANRAETKHVEAPRSSKLKAPEKSAGSSN